MTDADQRQAVDHAARRRQPHRERQEEAPGDTCSGAAVPRQPFELRRVDAAREKPVGLRRFVREEFPEVFLGEVLGVGLEEGAR